MKYRKHKLCLYEYSKGTVACDVCGRKPESYESVLKKKVKAVSITDKQKILDLLHEGKTIGEVERNFPELDLMVVCGVITENIGSYGKYLRKEPKGK